MRDDDAYSEGQKRNAEDPRTHLALGFALARSGSKDDAKIELEKSIETAKAKPLLMRSPEIRAAQELKRLEGN